MSKNLYRESAEIFDIFSGKRISARGDRGPVIPVVDRAFERHPDVMAATGWYHDAAINEGGVRRPWHR